MDIEMTELVCKRVHMPYPNVRIPAGEKIAIGPKWLVDALCARGFFERTMAPVVESSVKPPDEQPLQKVEKKGK